MNTDDTNHDNSKNNSQELETPLWDSIINRDEGEPTVEEQMTEAHAKPWYNIILSGKFRKYAYGVAIAAVTLWAIRVGQPEFIAVAAPLIMAILFVDKDGESLK